MTITEQQVNEVTGEIWGSMLDMHPQPTHTPDLVSNAVGAVGASVQITGAWQGAVRVDCSLTLARMVAARFLGITAEEVTIDQLRDAMGELANMSAGSFKSLLPGPSFLSLPSVADGTDYNLTIPRSETMSRADFHCHGEPLSVMLLRKQ